ncbi:MAG: S1C family serine protease [Akkermansiaceae bacterium]
MKTKTKTKLRVNTKGLIGITSAALLMPATAIEKPHSEEAPKEKAENAPVVEEAPKAAKPAQKIAMLGVGGMTTSETLSLHLGLDKGESLTLYHIAPGSAADKAGLQQHDILTEFDGKKIGDQQDLREAVQAKKPGDEVLVKFISKGKAHEKEITLGERRKVPGIVPAPGINPEWLKKNFGGNMPPAGIVPMNAEMMQRMQKQMDIQMQKLRGGQGGAMRLELGKLLKQAQNQGGGKGVFNFGIGTSVTMMDNEGSISMKTSDGKKEVIVKDKAGKTLFEGPYQTDQDKAAVPDEIRDRIDRLNLGEDGNRLKLRIMPPMNLPPKDEVEEEPAE